ncbi:hypothetical protein EON67_04460 [archaeon]|nr:MAG: hypothetical protein EON67_04460 [archaeon]
MALLQQLAAAVRAYWYGTPRWAAALSAGVHAGEGVQRTPWTLSLPDTEVAEAPSWTESIWFAVPKRKVRAARVCRPRAWVCDSA